jgi:thioester reductase-like protein
MAILLTGATGYIGAQVTARLLERRSEPVVVLVRDGSPARLWKALQVHIPDEQQFRAYLDGRLRIVPGDLTAKRFGLDPAAHDALAESVDSIIHGAATLNRRSERACMNVGKRLDEVVTEDEAIDWARSDYDPYARTKKFAEHLVAELLPDVERIVFRPSIVLGNSRRPETTSFEMVRAFAFLARLPALPLCATDLVDIVPVDYVADAIQALHCGPKPSHTIYHLSSGRDSPTFRDITTRLAQAESRGKGPWYWPWSEPIFSGAAALGSATLRGTGIGRACSRMRVFMPYLKWNTVFDNRRIVDEIGFGPAPFVDYCAPLLRWSLDHRFTYPYREWPDS